MMTVVGASTRVGGTPVTANVTATVRGLLFAALDATLTVAEYVPIGSVPVDAFRVSVAGALDVLRLAVSQPVELPL
jgi:hypothetical protein